MVSAFEPRQVSIIFRLINVIHQLIDSSYTRMRWQHRIQSYKVSDSKSFKVYTAGGVMDGFAESDVVSSFSQEFGVPAEKAQAFIAEKKLVRKGLSRSVAESYQHQLQAIGLPIIIAAADGTESVGEASPKPAAPALTLAPATATGAVASASSSGVLNNNPGASAFHCPKCQLPQEKSEECTRCGIIFSRYETSITSQQRDGVKQGNSHKRTSHDLDENSNSLSVFILPVIFAIVGAFIWKTLALMLPGDLSIMALVIGGAIGVAAVKAGGEGSAVGATCAALALIAIVAGKYMYISHHHEQLMTLLGDGGADALFEDMFQQADTLFAENVETGEDSAVPVQITYSYEDSSPGDLASDLVSNASVTNMLINSLGPLDWLFALLGIVTAFMLGRSGSIP